jgi:hypothetical protein
MIEDIELEIYDPFLCSMRCCIGVVRLHDLDDGNYLVVYDCR